MIYYSCSQKHLWEPMQPTRPIKLCNSNEVILGTNKSMVDLKGSKKADRLLGGINAIRTYLNLYKQGLLCAEKARRS